MNGSNSVTYEIKKSRNVKLILLPIAILIILLAMFFMTRTTPKSIAVSFIKDLQNYNTDNVFSYIDFERMVMLKDTSYDFNNLETNLSLLFSKTQDERGNFTESIDYTKRHINAVITELKNENIFLTVNSSEVSEVVDNIYKVIMNITINKSNNSISDIFTFYIQKQEKNYCIIGISDAIYF